MIRSGTHRRVLHVVNLTLGIGVTAAAEVVAEVTVGAGVGAGAGAGASLQKPNLHVAHLLNQDQGQDLGRAHHRGPAPRQDPDQDPDLHYLPNMQVKAPRSAAPAKVPAEAGAGAGARAYPGEIFYHGKLASGSEALEVKPEDLISSDLLGSSVCGVDFKLKSVP